MVPIFLQRAHPYLNKPLCPLRVFCGSGGSFRSKNWAALRRFGRCRSASASRRGGCCPSTRWGTPGRHWEPAASASPEWRTRLRVWFNAQAVNRAIPLSVFFPIEDFWRTLAKNPLLFSKSRPILNFFCDARCLSAKQRPEWSTFISKDQLQIIAIRQPAIVEITPRTSKGDDDTDLISEPGSRHLCEIAKIQRKAEA